MRVEIYDQLSEDAKKIRKEVFMQEQGYEREFDDTDQKASHVVLYDDIPVATCRIFEGERKNEYILRRLAVIKPYRRQHIGSLMVNEAEKFVFERGGTSISLLAQCRVQGFYESLGYEVTDKKEEDEGCPHVWMKKTVKRLF